MKSFKRLIEEELEKSPNDKNKKDSEEYDDSEVEEELEEDLESITEEYGQFVESIMEEAEVSGPTRKILLKLAKQAKGMGVDQSKIKSILKKAKMTVKRYVDKPELLKRMSIRLVKDGENISVKISKKDLAKSRKAKRDAKKTRSKRMLITRNKSLKKRKERENSKKYLRGV